MTLEKRSSVDGEGLQRSHLTISGEKVRHGMAVIRIARQSEMHHTDSHK